MRFFLSAETTAPASTYWFALRAQVYPELLKLENRFYGQGLTKVGIISIILPDHFFEDGGYRERRLYSQKNKEADIRIRLDYNSFIRAKPIERKKMYINHIICSLKSIEQKLDKNFEFEKMIADISEVLGASGID